MYTKVRFRTRYVVQWSDVVVAVISPFGRCPNNNCQQDEILLFFIEMKRDISSVLLIVDTLQRSFLGSWEYDAYECNTMLIRMC